MSDLERLRFDAEALYLALDRRRRERRLSQRAVLDQAGVRGPSLFTRLGQGAAPDVHNLCRLLTWLGTTDLGPFIKEEDRHE